MARLLIEKKRLRALVDFVEDQKGINGFVVVFQSWRRIKAISLMSINFMTPLDASKLISLLLLKNRQFFAER